MVFATYRIARMVAHEEGPFEVFTRLRTLVVNKWPDTWLERGIFCALCVSFWAGFAVVALSFAWWGQLLIYGLGLSGASVALTIKIEG